MYEPTTTNMNKILFFIVFSFSALTAQTQKVNLKVQILNASSDSIVISGENFQRVILGRNGIFSDSFSVPTGQYDLEHEKNRAKLYLKNGYNLHFEADASTFNSTAKFTGKGENENNFLAAKSVANDLFARNQAEFQFKGDYPGFKKLLDARTAAFESKVNFKGLDADFVMLMKKDEQGEIDMWNEIFAPIKNATNVNGKKSSSFNYQNHKGGFSKLEDFAGKFIFIDVWATWCGPCVKQFPFVEKMAHTYKDKNIVFVSISIDSPEDAEKWKSFVTSKNLGGVQLMADHAHQSKFIYDYGIVSIPRFIIIAPDGTILDANAKMPSDGALAVQLDKLLN